MLSRIEEDRVRLRHSLAGLEQANRELKSAQNEIIRAEKLASIGRMSANLAHEIGNPIGIVLGYLGLLKKRSADYKDQTAMDYINRAESEIQRVHEVVASLLDFSRRRESRKEIVDLHGLIREVGEMLSCQPMFSKISLKYSLNAYNDRIYADASGLYQVLVNLMINSADSISESANARSGEICLETDCIRQLSSRLTMGLKHDFIEFKISDNGAGIKKEYADQIFDPFFTTKESGRGTGLGLSVSFMIIEQMGGEIDLAESKPGFTQMIVRIPLASDTGRAGEGASARNSVREKGTHR
jgi:signal transduction histidine kinase